MFTSPVPALPSGWFDDGYDWMEALEPPWRRIAGTETHMYGDWPYVVVAYADIPPATDDHGAVVAAVYAMAVYVEQDIQTATFTSREERTKFVIENFGHED